MDQSSNEWQHVDVAVIGCGASGKPLATTLANAGNTVAVIERSKHMYGGACVNTACLPSKMLVHAAATSATLGGALPERSARYQAVIREKNEKTALIRQSIRHSLDTHDHIQVIEGEASFTDATHLVIQTDTGERHLEASRIFIDTGSEAILPDIPGIDGKNVYTSESLLNVETMPESVVIIGAGYVGLEFASLFANFGVEVWVLQGGTTFLPHEDADIAAAVRKNFEQRGINLMLGAKVECIEDDAVTVFVTAVIDSKEKKFSGDLVLVAAGRKPATSALNLRAAGIEANERGSIVTDEHLHTTAPNIWAMGDATDTHPFTYVSYDDYRIVASDVLADGSRTTNSRGAIPSCIFTDPPCAHVGMTEREARDAGFDVVCATMSSDDFSKPHLLGKQALLMKAVVDHTTDRVLGIHLYCDDAPEIINLAKFALDNKCTAANLRDAIFTHPTITEELNNLFGRIG